MQKYTPFTDDLQIALGRCQARFKCAVAVVLVIALCAVCVTLWQIGRAKPLVLEESTKELLLKEASVDRKLKAWCDDVEAFADNIARQSLVQLSVSSYAAMSKEDYQAEVENLSADIADAMTAMGSLSITDEESARTGVDTLRSMAQPFRDFAAIPNPPEEWAEGHGKIAEGCTLFADSLEGLCDSAIGVLDGEMDQEAYAAAITDYSTSLTDAATLITEGLGMLEM